MSDFQKRDTPRSGYSAESHLPTGEVRHPGEVLSIDYMKPLGLSVQVLAETIGVSDQRLYELISAKRSMTPDTAIRLSTHFPVPARYWLELQLPSPGRDSDG